MSWQSNFYFWLWCFSPSSSTKKL